MQHGRLDNAALCLPASAGSGLVSRLIVVLCALALVPSALPLAAQGTGFPVHTVGGGFGWERLVLRDEHSSPVRYAGWALPLLVSHRLDSGRFGHHLIASYGRGTLESAITEAGERAEQLQEWRVRHQLMTGLGELGGFDWAGGLAFEGAVRTRQHRYVGSIEERFILSIFALGPLLRSSVTVAPGVVAEAWLALPLAAVVARSPYSVKGFLDTTLEPVGRFVRVTPGAACRWQLGEALGVELMVEGRYAYIRDPFVMREFQQMMALRLLWRP